MSSYNVNVNESPNHFMILDSIARGMTNVNNIAKVTKLHKVEIDNYDYRLLSRFLGCEAFLSGLSRILTPLRNVLQMSALYRDRLRYLK